MHYTPPTADLSTPDGPMPAPNTRLVAYTRLFVKAGSCATVSWTLNAAAWTAAAQADGALWTQSGRVAVSVGGGQLSYAATGDVLSATAYLGPPLPLASCGDAVELQKSFYGGM